MSSVDYQRRELTHACSQSFSLSDNTTLASVTLELFLVNTFTYFLYVSSIYLIIIIFI